MIFALLVAVATCGTAWFITGSAHQRPIGALLGLIDSLLWLCAGVTAGKLAVVIVAAFCAFCFARPFLRAHVYARLRRHHAH